MRDPEQGVVGKTLRILVPLCERKGCRTAEELGSSFTVALIPALMVRKSVDKKAPFSVAAYSVESRFRRKTLTTGGEA